LEIEIKARIERGPSGSRLVIDNEKILESAYQKLPDEVQVTITAEKKTRSQKQNRWYWGIAIPTIITGVKEQTGENYTKEEIHKFNLQEVCKVKFRTRTIMGKTVMIFDDISTSKMNTQEFNNFKDELQMYWSQRDIIVPDPNQESFLNQF